MGRGEPANAILKFTKLYYMFCLYVSSRSLSLYCIYKHVFIKKKICKAQKCFYSLMETGSLLVLSSCTFSNSVVNNDLLIICYMLYNIHPQKQCNNIYFKAKSGDN